jgi:hypothetical protein
MSYENSIKFRPQSEAQSTFRDTCDFYTSKVKNALTPSNETSNKIHAFLSYMPIIGTGYGIKHAIDAWNVRKEKPATNLRILEIFAEVLSLRIVYLAVSETASAVKSCYNSCATRFASKKTELEDEFIEKKPLNSNNENIRDFDNKEIYETY